MNKTVAMRAHELIEELKQCEAVLEIMKHGYEDEWIITNTGTLGSVELKKEQFYQFKNMIECEKVDSENYLKNLQDMDCMLK